MRVPWTGLAVAAASVVAVTLLLYPLQELDPGVSAGVLYVLGALLVATRWGLALGVITSFVGVFALAFFHTEPKASLSVDKASDATALLIVLITSLVASVIADRARRS